MVKKVKNKVRKQKIRKAHQERQENGQVLIVAQLQLKLISLKPSKIKKKCHNHQGPKKRFLKLLVITIIRKATIPKSIPNQKTYSNSSDFYLGDY